MSQWLRPGAWRLRLGASGAADGSARAEARSLHPPGSQSRRRGSVAQALRVRARLLRLRGSTTETVEARNVRIPAARHAQGQPPQGDYTGLPPRLSLPAPLIDRGAAGPSGEGQESVARDSGWGWTRSSRFRQSIKPTA